MSRKADLFAEARGGVSSYVAKGQSENTDSEGSIRSNQVCQTTRQRLSAVFVVNHI